MGNRVSDDSSLCQLRKIYGKSVFQRAKQATYEQCRFVLRNNVDYLFKKEWHGRQELNPQPTDLESVALPIELHPCEVTEVRARVSATLRRGNGFAIARGNNVKGLQSKLCSAFPLISLEAPDP